VLTGPDALAIHQENIEKLSKMSAEEILQEQQKLVSQLDSKLVTFIRSRRERKDCCGIVSQTVKEPSHDLVLNSEVSSCLKMDTDLPCDSESGVSLTRDVKDLPSRCIDVTDVSQSEDRVQMYAGVAESENEKQTQSDGLQSNSTSCQADVDMSSIAVDLAVKSIEANRWLHMDVIEHEKLQWIGDICPAPPAPPDAPYSARFDFQGMKLIR
jgi:hypothetical protein